jgi:dimethylsulfoniopropionate demethylase
MGVKIDHNKIDVSKAIDITINSKRIGELRSGVYSPTFKQVIGIAMIDKPFFEIDTKVEININSEIKTGVICNIPFV